MQRQKKRYISRLSVPTLPLKPELAIMPVPVWSSHAVPVALTEMNLIMPVVPPCQVGNGHQDASLNNTSKHFLVHYGLTQSLSAP